VGRWQRKKKERHPNLHCGEKENLASWSQTNEKGGGNLRKKKPKSQYMAFNGRGKPEGGKPITVACFLFIEGGGNVLIWRPGKKSRESQKFSEVRGGGKG